MSVFLHGPPLPWNYRYTGFATFPGSAQKDTFTYRCQRASDSVKGPVATVDVVPYVIPAATDVTRTLVEGSVGVLYLSKIGPDLTMMGVKITSVPAVGDLYHIQFLEGGGESYPNLDTTLCNNPTTLKVGDVITTPNHGVIFFCVQGDGSCTCKKTKESLESVRARAAAPPPVWLTGPLNFSYALVDNATQWVSNSASVKINVEPVNAPPVGKDLGLRMAAEDEFLEFDLPAADADGPPFVKDSDDPDPAPLSTQAKAALKKTKDKAGSSSASAVIDTPSDPDFYFRLVRGKRP